VNHSPLAHLTSNNAWKTLSVTVLYFKTWDWRTRYCTKKKVKKQSKERLSNHQVKNEETLAEVLNRLTKSLQNLKYTNLRHVSKEYLRRSSEKI
jgi:hypothetical protein